MYTIEVYKADKRFKDGSRLVNKTDYVETDADKLYAEALRFYPIEEGYTCVLYQTYVEKIHLMTGEKFMERYDTPHYCSPSSETYWST